MKGGFLVALALVLATVTAAAVPAPTGLPVAPSLAALAADPSLGPALGAALAAQAAQASPTAVLRAMLAAQGLDEAPMPVAAAPLAGAPPELALPLGRLVAAAALAEQLRAEALAALADEERALAMEGFLAPTPLAVEAPALVGGDGVAAHVALPGAGAWALDPRAEAIAAKVDAAKLRVAALTLLAAVEASAGELRAAAAFPGHAIASHCGATGTVRFESSGCEVIVGDTGPNTYTRATTVVLADLGGADVYDNGAALARSGVRVLADVSGGDTYAVSRSSATGAGVTAEGIAFANLGVAVLADLDGSDAYAVSAATAAPQPGPAAGTARASGIAVANVGAAILADLGGADRFTATATSSGGGAAVLSQGRATIGLGALLNLGPDAGADDTYTALAASTLHLVSQTPTLSQYTIGPAEAAAQAAADLAGVAVLTDAGGDDAYDATATAGVASVRAQAAAVGGAALLVDSQGNDAMATRAVGDTTLTLIVENGANAMCWSVEVTVNAGETRASSQGAAAGGAALLIDGTGNDVRHLVARSHAGAVGGVNTTFDCRQIGLVNSVTSIATSGPGTATGQGSGNGGLGALVDLAGNDRNLVEGHSTALAYAVVNHPARAESATATAGRGDARGQGHSLTGLGLLADVLGADRHGSAASSAATQTTSAGSTVAQGPVAQSVQGWGNGGLGWLLELDGADAYTTSPPGASAAGNNKCWSNGPNGGRGRDMGIGPMPPDCP